MTSNHALQKVRRLFGKVKAGHAGTLDPLATGLLIIGLGEATKLLQYLLLDQKAYEFEVTWGASRTTDDAEGEIIKNATQRPSEEEISSVIPQFTGLINQIPPLYCALKRDGKRFCDAARLGHVEMPQERQVLVKELSLLNRNTDRAVFRVKCGSGTYVRSIARDIGETLGCYGYVSMLRRIELGQFHISKAISLEKLIELCNVSSIEQALYPLDTTLDDIPAIPLTDEDDKRIQHGNAIQLKEESLASKDMIQLLNPMGKLSAIAYSSTEKIFPKKVFNL